MSSSAILRVSQPGINENSQVIGKGKLVDKSEKTARKSLHPIQSSATEKQLTRDAPPQGQKTLKQLKIFPSAKPVVVFKDDGSAESKPRSPTEGATCSCNCHPTEHEHKTEEKSVNTDNTEEAMALMGPGEPSTGYWKTIAEERRLALTDALEENEQLHSEIFKLREENQSLQELAEQAEYFANLFKTLTEEKEEENTETDEETS